MNDIVREALNPMGFNPRISYSPTLATAPNQGGGWLSGALGGLGGMFGGGGRGGMDLSFLNGVDWDNLTPDQTSALQTRIGAANLIGNQPTGFQTGLQNFGSLAQGLMGLGNMYLGWQGMKEQKRNNAFQREVMNTNLNNSIGDYNRRLTDTLSNRALNNGGGEGWVSSQLEKYQAKRG